LGVTKDLLGFSGDFLKNFELFEILGVQIAANPYRVTAFFMITAI
jgi:hypothetical protein